MEGVDLISSLVSFRQRKLELLRGNSGGCSLRPSRKRPVLTIDSDELLLGRTAREFEQPDAIRPV
jgi:hypothetical protein